MLINAIAILSLVAGPKPESPTVRAACLAANYVGYGAPFAIKVVKASGGEVIVRVSRDLKLDAAENYVDIGVKLDGAVSTSTTGFLLDEDPTALTKRWDKAFKSACLKIDADKLWPATFYEVHPTFANKQFKFVFKEIPGQGENLVITYFEKNGLLVAETQPRSGRTGAVNVDPAGPPSVKQP